MAKVNPMFLAQEPDASAEAAVLVQFSYHAWVISYDGADQDSLIGSMSDAILAQLGFHPEEIAVSITETDQQGEYHMEEDEVPSKDWSGSVVISAHDDGTTEDFQAEVNSRLTGDKDFQDASGLLRFMSLTPTN